MRKLIFCSFVICLVITTASYGTSNIEESGYEKVVDEIVTLKNSSQDINMTGWKLISEVGGESYEFPQDYILKSETTIQVVSGRGKIGNGESVLKWTDKNVWNNKGDACSLIDENGQEIFKSEIEKGQVEVSDIEWQDE